MYMFHDPDMQTYFLKLIDDGLDKDAAVCMTITAFEAESDFMPRIF